MAISNRYQLIDAQTYLEQGVLNIYHYKQISGAGGSASELSFAWTSDVLPQILPLQSSSLVHQVITVTNLDDLDDFSITPLTTGNTGEDTSVNPLASFYAFAFQYVRASRSSRHGWKRIAGIVEEAVVGNAAVGTYLSLANGLSVYLEADQVGSGGTYRPVILRKNIVPTASLDFPIQSVVFRGVTTQNTRKKGRGM